jgi:hypothetical protein
VQRFGRIAYNRYAARKIKDRRGERAPLLSSNSFKAKKENEEANHFDVSFPKYRWPNKLIVRLFCYSFRSALTLSP